MKLTKSTVDELVCPPGRKDAIFFAEDLAGFGCRVTKDGAKVFLLQYRVGHRVRRLVIGPYGQITPAQARALAQQAHFILASGKDPIEERQRARIEAEFARAEAVAKVAAKANALRFGELVDRWHAIGLKDRRQAYRDEAKRALKVNFKAFLLVPVLELTQSAIQAELDQIVEVRGVATAQRSRALGSAMCGWAMKRALLPGNPFANVAVEGRLVSRDRFLTDAEIGEVWRATAELGAPFDKFFRILMLTLQRVSETAGLAWSELSADRKEWTIPAARAKNGRAHLVHLAPVVRAILASIPQTPDTDLVFATARRPLAKGAGPPTDDDGNPLPPNPLSGFSHAKARLDKKIAEARRKANPAVEKPAPMLPWRLHDLRRTGVTVIARLGGRIEVADRLLNHVQGGIQGVAAVYQRYDFMNERRKALEDWATHVQAVADGDDDANNVVPIVCSGTLG